MRVSDVMSTPVYTVKADEPAATAWERMGFYRTRHLIVTGDDDHVIGVISASDLGGKHGEPMRARRQVGELMTEKLVVVHPDTTIREAANLMRGHAVNCLPVFNGHGRLKGIVTVVDLLELIGRGTERPVTVATRPVLKSRGVVPRQARARNQGSRIGR